MIFVSGCRYSEKSFIQYPCSSFPSGGIYSHIDDEYLQYQKEVKEREERFREEQQRKNEENYHNFFKRHFDPFGDFGRRDMPEFFEEMDVEDQKDYPFSVFGLKKSSSQEDMKKAYHKAVRETHPDKTGEDTEDEFRQVQEAYEYYQNNMI